MIDIAAVTVRRDGRTIIESLSLTLPERRIGIIGANGSGKSTFARLLNGLVLPDEGTASVFGLDTRAATKEVRRRVGFVFQNPDNQIVYPTVGEDVAFGLRRLKLPADEERRRVAERLALHGLTGFEDRLVHTLSGGERQMVALAGVLVTQPDLLVLDEPTTLLDRRNRARILRAVDAYEGQVVMVTHDLDLLAGFDRVLVFEEGRVVADAAPAAAVAFYEELCG